MAHMRNMAFRHRRAVSKLMAKHGPSTTDYVITDSAHRPDLRGELAGAKVRQHDDKQVVKLTKKAARFYLDSGSLQPLHDNRHHAKDNHAEARDEG